MACMRCSKGTITSNQTLSVQVDPMNTIVRKDDGVPVIIPNSAASEYLVANESRSKKMAPKAA